MIRYQLNHHSKIASNSNFRAGFWGSESRAEGREGSAGGEGGDGDQEQLARQEQDIIYKFKKYCVQNVFQRVLSQIKQLTVEKITFPGKYKINSSIL